MSQKERLLVARPPVDRDRARGPQSADDHQGVAARAAAAGRSTPARLREAVADIDEEVARLNRIVNEVLDFARPIRFELAPADLNALCRESAAGVAGRRPAPPVGLDLDPSLPAVTTDAERLRIALVNMLVNARHAVERRSRGQRRSPRSLPSTRDRATARVTIVVADRGAGIEPVRSRRTCSTRTSRPSAAAPASACPSPRTSSKGSAARSRVASAAGARHGDPHRASVHAVTTAPPSLNDDHRGSILLVDDEEKILKALGRALRDAGPRRGRDRRARARRSGCSPSATFDVLIVDNVMPELSGLDLIREYVASTPEGERAQILMMTAHATVESAIEAMKLGALDYLQKPFEIDELLVVVRRALDHQRLRTEYRYLLSERDEQFDHYGIIGRSRAMEEVIQRAELVAETKSTVLITGETGTGKELVARAIHDRSAQRDMPLIKVNCAAIPETLLESELFGHVRGAFTGATTTKKGKFALADGGTIFLDEIGTMSPTLQSKLLRVLQEREFEPLGAERTETRRRARHRRDQPRPAADGGRRQVPGGSVLPAERDPDRDSAAARAARRHSRARRALRAEARAAHRAAHRADRRRRAGRPAAVRLAGQRPRARKHDRARRRAVARPGHHRRARSRCSAPPRRRRRALPSLKLRQNIEWVERETIRRALESAGGVKKDAAELMGISQRALSYYLAKYRIDA